MSGQTPPSSERDGLRQRAEAILLARPPHASASPSRDAQHLARELEIHTLELEVQNDELRRAQGELEDSRQRLVDLYDQAPICYVTVDRLGVIREANLTAAETLRVPRGSLIAKPLVGWVAKDDKRGFFAYVRRCFDEGSAACALRLVTLGGPPLTVQVHGRVVEDDESGPLCRLCLVDVALLDRSRQDAFAAERQWQQTFDSVPDLIAVLDREHRIVRANRPMAERLGASPEECVGRACYQCVHGLDAPPDFCPHSKLLADGQGHTDEVYEPRLGGHFLVSTTPLVDEEGRVIGSVHVARDLTEHRRAAEQARSMAQFPEENPNPVLRTAHDGRVLFANGPAREFLKGMGWETDGAVREPLLGAVRRVIAEGANREIEIICPRGRAFSFVLAPSSTEGHVNLYGSDITQRKREAEELQKANRMLRALTNSNHALLHASEEAAYLEEVCRIIIEDCGHAMVWVGLAEHDQGKSVRPAASAGFDDGYLETMKVTWADTERGRGPTGTAIRTGQVQLCRDMLSEPQFLPWRDAAVRRGYASSIALPLWDGGRAFGALTIYARKPNAFSDDEVRLLTELAADFSHGIRSLHTRAAHARAEDALWRSEARLRLHVDNSPLAVVEWDADQKILRWTGQAAQVFGWRAEEVLGKRLWDFPFIHADDQAAIATLTAGMLHGGNARIINVNRNYRKDGAVIWCQWYNSALVDVSGRVVSVLSLALDVTERHRAARQLREAKEAAEAANASKSQFLANMSHELRTPMNGVMGMMELALDDELPAEVRDNLRMAKESADVLLELLSHLLDFSGIEAGRLQLRSTPFHLRTALDKALHPLGLRARQKGLDLRCRLAPDLPDHVVGDPRALRQVIANLVGNAIKFTDRGEVAVQVGWATEQGAGSGDAGAGNGEQGAAEHTQDSLPAPCSLLHFSVTDTGIGISAEDQKRIFAPFTQADGTMTRPYGGTGLGLAVSDRLVALMGGRMWVESVPGSGSAFHFTARLPSAEAEAGVVAVRPKAAAPVERVGPAVAKAPPRPLRILLAEDTPANQRLMVRALAKRGHLVEVASNGQEALELLGRQDFDLVLMDVQMPVLDGFEATAAIRALGDRRKARIAIIAVTAHALEGDRERCLAAGMDDYLSKPVHVGELTALVERLGFAPSPTG